MTASRPTACRLLGAVLLLLSGSVHAAKPEKPVIEGKARVVDGDTLWIGNSKIRLYGIDAPEKAQTCKDPKGVTYPCGQASTDELKQIVGKSPLRCEVKDVDQYGRNVAACSLKPTTPAADAYDVNAMMVSTGHATAYRGITKVYVPQEDQAKRAKKGIWAGTFTRPSNYRKEVKAAEGAAQAQPGKPQPQPRPQQPRPVAPQQLPLGPRPQQPAASSVGAGTGSKPSYAGALTG